MSGADGESNSTVLLVFFTVNQHKQKLGSLVSSDTHFGRETGSCNVWPPVTDQTVQCEHGVYIPRSRLNVKGQRSWSRMRRRRLSEVTNVFHGAEIITAVLRSNPLVLWAEGFYWSRVWVWLRPVSLLCLCSFRPSCPAQKPTRQPPDRRLPGDFQTRGRRSTRLLLLSFYCAVE